MSECVMLIASAKIPAGKRCDLGWPQIGLSKEQNKNRLTKTVLSASPLLVF